MSETLKKASSNRLLKPLIRLFVGLALLSFLFLRHADLRKVWDIVASANPAVLITALCIAIIGEIVTAFKWCLLVDHIKGELSLRKAVRASFIGMFYNNFFPGSVGGDIARVLLISREAGGKAKATASAFMQRDTGLAGLFIIGIFAAFLWPRHIDWPGVPPTSSLYSWITDCRLWLLAAAVGYAGVNTILFSQNVYNRIWTLVKFESIHRAPSRIHAIWRAFIHKVQRFHTELQGYHFWLPLPLFLSATTQLIDIFMVWNLSRALGLDISIFVLLVTVPMVTLANLAPITINGIGLRETMYVALLYSAGISASQAVALSLMQFAVIMTLAAIGGTLHWLRPSEQNSNISTGN